MHTESIVGVIIYMTQLVAMGVVSMRAVAVTTAKLRSIDDANSERICVPGHFFGSVCDAK